MPINSFKIATAWSRLTWMQRHVLRVWEHTNYCANVWDYSGNYYGKKFRATDPDHQTATQFDTGNWCFGLSSFYYHFYTIFSETRENATERGL